MNIHDMWRESKQLKDPDECAIKKQQDCECSVYCKMSLYCNKHEDQDSECVDCAWDVARSMNEQVKELHRLITRHAIDAVKSRRELTKLKNP